MSDYARIDGISSHLETEIERLVELLGRLSGELQELDSARKAVALAQEDRSEDGTSEAFEAGQEAEENTMDQLPDALERCEMALEDLIQFLVRDVQQAFADMKKRYSLQ